MKRLLLSTLGILTAFQADKALLDAPSGKDFHGTVRLLAQGKAEIWDAVSGPVKILF